MAYPEKLTFAPKYNLRPIIEPNGQFSAENANEVFEKVNKNALFHDVHADLSTLQTVHPNPPVGAFAYLLDGSHYKCVSVGWKKSPGISPYDLAVQNGYVGDVPSWLLTLVGPAGAGAIAAPSPTEILSFSPNWQSGLTFYPSATWIKNGTTLNDSRQVILTAADATLDRFDLFAVNLTTDQIEIIEGTPANPAVEPSYDPLVYLAANFVSIKAGATAPENVVGTPIWTEGAEWLTTNAGPDFDFANIESPYSGTYAIKVVSPLISSQSLPFIPPSPVLWEDGMEISYKTKNITGGDYRWLIGGLKSNGKAGSIWINPPLNYSDSSLVYQLLSVIIPAGLATITKISLVANVDGLEYYLDDVRLVTGGGNVVAGGATKEYVDFQDAAILQAAKDFSNSLDHSGGGGSPLPPYATMAALYADQVSQTANASYKVTDASAYATVNSGSAWFDYLGTTVGDATDYEKRSESESMDLDLSVLANIRLANVAADLSAGEKAALLVKLGAVAQTDIDVPLIVSTSRAFAATDIGKVLYITQSVTLTYPTGGIPNFKTNIVCNAAGQCTLAGDAADILFNAGQIILADKAVTLFREPVTSKLTGYGEFSV